MDDSAAAAILIEARRRVVTNPEWRAQVARPDRFEFADDMFMRRHRGAGAPVINQFTWRLPGPLDPSAVRAFGAALADGALHRRATRSPVPTARDRWAPSDAPAAISVQAEAVEPGGVLDWMAGEAAGIDPGAGVSWRLAAAPVAGQSAIVSLAAAHAVADGAAFLDAIVRGATGAEPVPVHPLPARGALLKDDLRDAAGQAKAIAQWVRDRRGAGPEPTRTPLTPVTDDPDLPAAWTTPIAIADVATADLERVVAERGGSQNAWFVAATARLSSATGRVVAGDHVPVALPVARRKPQGDRRSNSTDIARADIDPETLASGDLRRVYALCKQAYLELAAAPPPPVPLAAVQMLPDVVVKRLPQPPAATLLASNLGSFPESGRRVFGAEPAGIAALAYQFGATAPEIDAAGPGLCAWVNTSGPVTTISIAAFDPRRVPDRATLNRLLGDELASWGLTAQLW